MPTRTPLLSPPYCWTVAWILSVPEFPPQAALAGKIGVPLSKGCWQEWTRGAPWGSFPATHRQCVSPLWLSSQATTHRGPQQQRFASSQPWRLAVQGQGAGEDPLPGLLTADFSLPAHICLSASLRKTDMRLSGVRMALLEGPSSYQIRTLPTLVPSTKVLSANIAIPGFRASMYELGVEGGGGREWGQNIQSITITRKNMGV